MDKEYIQVEDSLDVLEIRQLIEVTNTMAKAINREEFKKILVIYGQACERLLNEGKRIWEF